ncbi:XkdX family protein [Chengkuizengella axinellae]|uniref:XkdX family protein n=1 Tax=Chengkuizengella axinellae TaxID=3064388 RepID=A0ABT9J6M0_9BACL|nr:XkdX family protein [Chengkuizengella sp. 2205SS18-9]MDP5277261.1 XkdX family protein [Chengkuizengella sp. 2205SS18-9]
MDWVKIIQRYYPKYYSKDNVKVFVERQKITAEEYEQLVGEPYTV